MVRDYSLKALKDISDRLEVRPRSGENEADFRKRLCEVVLEKYGDSILATEILTGKDSSLWNRREHNLSFGIHSQYHKSKEDKLEMQGDTHYQMSKDYYYDLLLGTGFKKVFSYNFKGSENKNEEFSLWFEKTGGC